MSRTIGGSFILDEVRENDVFTPEDFSEEQKMIGRTTEDFVSGEVLPHDETLEKLDYRLSVQLLLTAGELGLLSADIPEAYGGLGLDHVSSTVISEKMAKASSFALTVGAHVGIGTLPIVYFGNEEQKRKYLPALSTGEKIAAYCLTEPSSGSDALGAKATAVLSDDRTHFILNGTKQFITNAAFADLFIVYAKVDGTAFSTFIVERTMDGVSVGPEEKKMGIKGSSTCPLVLEDVKVPVENVLWEVGKGHLIAFNILNIGRFKLAAGCLGGAKEALALAAAYANQRRQFGRPISSFPLIGQKLADMNIRTYVLEGMVYRTAGLIGEALGQVDHEGGDAGRHTAKAIAEYALESSINKVFGSETLDFIVDEGVQIHGGYGFIQEYRIERMYRDSRINRIFEGTNEINRLLIPGTLMKRALKGELPLFEKAMALESELLTWTPAREHHLPFGEETELVGRAKRIFLLIGAQAVQKYGAELEKEQEVLIRLADMMIEVYAMESALLRAKKQDPAANGQRLIHEMTTVFIHDTYGHMEQQAREALAYMATGDMLRTQLSVLKKLTRRTPIDTIAIKRRIAARVVAAERYVVG